MDDSTSLWVFLIMLLLIERIVEKVIPVKKEEPISQQERRWELEGEILHLSLEMVLYGFYLLAMLYFTYQSFLKLR